MRIVAQMPLNKCILHKKREPHVDHRSHGSRVPYTGKQREGEMRAPVVFIYCILASGLAHGQAVSQISEEQKHSWGV
jgi:hypothetical protein